MNAEWQALAREAELAADQIAIGITAIDRASFARDAYYGQAFFALSIGFERAAKVALLVDYALENNGAFPPPKVLREYGHDLRKLLEELDKIGAHRGTEHRLPRSEIQDAIIKVLSDFSTNITRYYNLDFLTGDTDAARADNPIGQWFNKVTSPVLTAHYAKGRREKHERRAEMLDDLLGESVLVRHTAETGTPLRGIAEASKHAAAVEAAKPYTRMYVMQIARFIADVMSELTFAAYSARLESIPHLSEFFAIFNNSDEYFRSRRTWSIYGR
jgi:hypothetical protein